MFICPAKYCPVFNVRHVRQSKRTALAKRNYYSAISRDILALSGLLFG
jgi:hypothetical protein